jgi:hypothetical protein
MSRKFLIPLLTATFQVLAASLLLVMVTGSAVHAKVLEEIGPKQKACVDGGGLWRTIYDPFEGCPLVLPNGAINTEDCGHCFDHAACQNMYGLWNSSRRVCTQNNLEWTDYPGWCNGSLGGTSPSGGYNPFSHGSYLNCGGTSAGSAPDSGGPVGIHCPPGYEPNDMGACEWGATGPNTGIFCVDNPLSCVVHYSFVFTNLPMDVNCLMTMDVEDPPFCFRRFVQAPGGGNDCLSRGGSLASDIGKQGLICWSNLNSGVVTARIEVAFYDNKAKQTLKDCWPKGDSLTLRNGAFACVETPVAMVQAIAQYGGATSRFNCKPPMVPNKDRTGCSCPQGTELKGQECIRPIKCRPPMIPNAAGECTCPPGTVQRGRNCVPPIECRPPMIPNGTGTACVCPPGMVQKGQECARQVECRPPMIPNGAGTACVCPSGTVQNGQECTRQVECRPPMIPNGAGTACVCPSGTVQNGQECVRPIECRPPMISGGPGRACVCPPGTVQNGQDCVQPMECRPPMISGGPGRACVCPPGTVQNGQECVR